MLSTPLVAPEAPAKARISEALPLTTVGLSSSSCMMTCTSKYKFAGGWSTLLQDTVDLNAAWLLLFVYCHRRTGSQTGKAPAF